MGSSLIYAFCGTESVCFLHNGAVIVVYAPRYNHYEPKDGRVRSYAVRFHISDDAGNSLIPAETLDICDTVGLGDRLCPGLSRTHLNTLGLLYQGQPLFPIFNLLHLGSYLQDIAAKVMNQHFSLHHLRQAELIVTTITPFVSQAGEQYPIPIGTQDPRS